MNNKEALEMLYKNCPMVVTRESDGVQLYSEYLTEVIKQDLDRLEQLEKENKELRKAVKSWNENGGKLIRENTKLKKALGLIKDYLTIANDVPLMTFAERCFTEEEVKLLKSVLGEE